jgi:dTDP-4-amino-4,6-dideoxygalactose transaminase
MQKIPLVDLRVQYLEHQDEFDLALRRCLEKTSFIGGPDHDEFAARFAAFCGGGEAALCGNGTDALYLAILESIGEGDGRAEIVTVANTFIATSEAIVRAGYRPVFCDIDPRTYLMDPASLEASLTVNTRAVVPVHLYGQMAAMDKIMEIAAGRGLAVIEDAAQAHGAAYAGKGPGQWGQAAAFSFYPGKNLGAWGDGGAVFTRDPDLAARIRRTANHGRDTKYLHLTHGFNSRLDGLQAAILLVKLAHLEDDNASRRKLAAAYDALLAGAPGIVTPEVMPEAFHVYHLYVVQVEQRDAVLAKLREKGVMAGIHYPVPLHEQPVYGNLGLAATALPVSHALAKRFLSLPLYPGMKRDQVEYVAACLLTACAG